MVNNKFGLFGPIHSGSEELIDCLYCSWVCLTIGIRNCKMATVSFLVSLEKQPEAGPLKTDTSRWFK